MSCAQASSFLLLVGCLMTLCGCGATATTASPVATASGKTLAGNWLLYGTLPSLETGSNSSPGLAVNFDVVDNTIVGSATGVVNCGSGAVFGFTLATILDGTIAADGTFNVTSPLGGSINPVGSVVVQGTVPKSAGSPWTGVYKITNSGGSPALGTPCVINESGPFTAAVVNDITGSYTGMGTAMGPGLSSTALPVAITAVFQQDAPFYTFNSAAPAVTSRLALSGSLQVQGFSCFSHGTTSTSAPSEVEGSRVSAAFVMDDGSALQFLGSIADTSSSTISLGVLLVTGGTCEGHYSFGLQPLAMHRP